MLLGIALVATVSRAAFASAYVPHYYPRAFSAIARAHTMASQQKLAIVTGANKGIGFEIARAIGKHDGFKCILAARSEERGLRAAQELSADGANVEFRQLDLDNDDSIDRFVEGITVDYGKVDVLVNNAAIAFKAADPTPFHEQTAPTFHINFWQTIKLTDKILPLLVPGSRIVFLASSAGRLDILNQSPEKKGFVSRPDLTTEQLFDFINEFCEDVRAGQHREKGWPDTNYGMSKLGIVAYSRVLARQHPELIINACCPGYVNTDMTSHKGHKTPEEGARTPVLLATSPQVTSSGEFWRDERPIDWDMSK